MTGVWPIAVATHAARDQIGPVPAGDGPWRGWERWLDWVRDTGFDGVDLSTGVVPVERPDDWWRGLADSVRRRDLEIASINCLRSSLADPEHWRLGDARIRRALDLADLLGIPTVNVSLAIPPERADANACRMQAAPLGSSRTATAAQRRATLDRLRAIVAGRRGTADLVLELHHASVADTAPTAVDLAQAAGIPLNPDLVNELWAFDEPERDWRETLRMCSPVSSGIWHVKNCRRTTAPDGTVRFADAPLDDGEIDYAEAIGIMRGAGFDGWVSIERSGAGDFPATATRGIDFLHIHGIGRRRSTQ